MTAIILLFLFLGMHAYAKKLNRQWILGICIYGFLCCFGFQHANQNQKDNLPPSSNEKKALEWHGIVQSIQKKDSIVKSFVVKVLYLEDLVHQRPFKLLVYNQIDSLKVRLGDQLTSISKVSTIEAPLNPAQFNYKEFLGRKHIYLQTKLNDGYIINVGNSVFSRLHDLRKAITETYQKWGIQADELAVLTALTLGDKSKLDAELKSTFSGSGAMHILAVSGLHVGIIYLLIGVFTKLLYKQSNIWLRITAVFFELSCIWTFALLCGFSSSVQRASIMLSFIILAKGLNRKSQIINSIAVSAFIILLMDPNALFDVGFQLSFSAVLGIVLIYPPLRKLLHFKWAIWNKIYELSVVSIAAQLATLPFAIYYFHQFPNYFLLSNYIVVPLAFILVCLSYSTLFIELIVGQDFYLGSIINWILKVLNASTELINSLPMAVIDGIWIHTSAVILLFLIISFLTVWLHSKSGKYLLILLGLTSCLFTTQLWFDYQSRIQQKVFVYAFPKAVLSIIDGKDAAIIASKELTAYEKGIIIKHLDKLGIEKRHWEIIGKNHHITYNGLKVLMRPSEELLEIDSLETKWIMLDQRNTLENWKRLNPNSILDWSGQNRIKTIDTAKISIFYHNLKRSGALEIEIEQN